MDKVKLLDNFTQVLNGVPDDADMTKFLFCVTDNQDGFYAIVANEKAYTGSKGAKIEILADALSIITGLVTAHLMTSDGVCIRSALEELFNLLQQENEQRLAIIEQQQTKTH